MSSNASLAGQWNALKGRANRGAYLSADQERSLLLRSHAGDQVALLALVESHMRLVVDIASRYERSAIPPHDLVGEGTVGLIEAIRRFDSARAVRLSTYAKWWVRARVREYALANRNAVALPSTRGARVALAKLSATEKKLSCDLGRSPTRAEVATALGVSESAVDSVVIALSTRDLSLSVSSEDSEPADPRGGPEQEVADAEAQALVNLELHKALARLSERERLALDAYVSDEGKTLKRVGTDLGISRQRMSQVAAAVRHRLRAELGAVAC